MRTIKPLFVGAFICLFLVGMNAHGQNPLKKAKKKLEKQAEQVIDKELAAEDNKIAGSDEEVQVINEQDPSAPSKNFINGNIVFSDNFNSEKHGEFPSKWTQMKGTMQNSQVVAFEKEEGVVKFITAGRLKPTFKNDDYLGKSFKIEVQCFFRGIGNEAYTLNLMNKDDIYGAYIITIRGDGIVPAGTSSEYARMPYKLPYPGWRTVQLSFNNGTLKVSYEGTQLINIPTLRKYEDKNIEEFTHLEVSALPSGSNAMINHISIAHGGLPLYKKFMAEGRLVFHDILFDEGKYNILPSSYPSLKKIVKMLEEHPMTEITIAGHTNSKGTNESNQILSERRAEAVKNYLVSQGIKRHRLSSKGYGEEKPIDTRNNEEAWALNRRVEIIRSL